MNTLTKLLSGEFEITTKAKKHPKVIVSVKALVKRDNKYLLLLRSQYDRHNPLKWEFPGGSFEKSDTDLKKTLKREIKEETGLSLGDISNDCYVYLHNVSSNANSVYNGYKRLVLYYKATCLNSNVVLSKEHKDYVWLPLEEIKEKDLTGEALFALKSLSN